MNLGCDSTITSDEIVPSLRSPRHGISAVFAMIVKPILAEGQGFRGVKWRRASSDQAAGRAGPGC